MSELKTLDKITIIEDNIKKMVDKSFNIFFFVLDTKGNPSGSLEYIYETAYTLQENGYNVAMLHQESEFVGVTDWMGEKYNELKHCNVETDNVEIQACDFLFIPEILSNVMVQTKTLPCKRVLIVQNHNYLAEFMPIGATPEMLNVHEIITTTEAQAEIIKRWFPRNKVSVVEPYIKNLFRKTNENRNLVINIVAREQSDVNRIIKEFYWLYPMYKWVSFRDLRGMSQEMLCEALNDGILTIWVDDNTNFGYTALQAMRCGSLVLGKLPKLLPDWCLTDKNGEKELTKACLWFDNMNALPQMLASIVRSWTMDEIPENVYENISLLNDKYTKESFVKNIDKTYEGLFDGRKEEFIQALALFRNKKNEE